MNREPISKDTGIYLVYTKSSKLQSIYKQKNYKTLVNNQHTKIGITQNSFASRKKTYEANFGSDLVFKELIILDKKHLKNIEDEILNKLKLEFNKVGRSREWFDTTDRDRIIEIVRDVLSKTDFYYEVVF
jgi:hypothetical protein